MKFRKNSGVLAAAWICAGLGMTQFSTELAMAGTNKIDQALGRANQLIEQGKFQKAISKLRVLKFTGQKEAQRLFLLGRARGKLGNYKSAIADNLAALKIDPRMAPAYYNIACYYALSGGKEEAFRYLEALDTILQGSSDKIRLKYITLMQHDEDLKAVRPDKRFAVLLNQWKKLAMNAPAIKMIEFAGCGKRAKDGQWKELRHYNCQSFDGATFSGPADACPPGWVKVQEAVPKHLAMHLEQCIYEL